MMYPFLFFAFMDGVIYLADTLRHYWLLKARDGVTHAEPVETWRLLAFMIVVKLIQLGFAFSVALPNAWTVIAASCVLSLGLRWVMHDPLLNYLRGMRLDYLGDGIDDSLTDEVLKEIEAASYMRPGLVRVVALFMTLIFSLLILLT